MAEFEICVRPQMITTIGLGSCVGVVLYDPSNGICGMLHAMLPHYSAIRNNSNRAKFVDTGLEDMLAALIRQGADKKRLKAKVAGGAQMFDFSSDSDVLSVGLQNTLAVKETLERLRIPIVAEDIGEHYGRTICFDPATGELNIKAVGHSNLVI